MPARRAPRAKGPARESAARIRDRMHWMELLLGLTRRMGVSQDLNDQLATLIEIVTTESFSKVDQLDPDYDQHHLVAGPGGTIFALNWLHSTATRYNLAANQRVWHVTLQGRQLYDGAFIPGGWRWPWLP